MEAEYALTKAVGDFCREAVKEGSFKGGYRMNVKEQMEVRMGKIWSEGGKVRVVMVGGSQIGRLGDGKGGGKGVGDWENGRQGDCGWAGELPV